MTSRRSAKVVVIGLGHPDRGDDAVGPLVAAQAARLAGLEHDADPPTGPVDLIDRWSGADLAVVVDAVRSSAPPGTVHVLDTAAGPLDAVGAARPPASTHGLGLADTLRLAEALGSAPGRIVVVGIEGSDFDTGPILSPPVAGAVPHAVRTVLDLIRRAQPCA